MAGTFANLLYHIVFSTKNRRPFITPEIATELDPYIGGIVRNDGGILLEIGGMPDHRQLILKLRPDLPVSEMVRLIKTNSSKWANERLGRADAFGWQAGYAAFSVSASHVDGLRDYVRNQEEHHRKRTFQEEYLAFLNRHGIEFDERFVWD